MTTLVADLETDGLKPKKIHMVGIMDFDTKEYTSYIGEDEVPVGLMRLAEADRVVGHNLRSFDAKVIKDLTEGLIVIPDDKIDDTLEIGRMLFPQLENHKLKTYGEILGFPKFEYEGGWGEFTPEMAPYCQRDVELTAALYEFFLTQLAAICETEEEAK
ncbi:MAG: hypothetical protein EOP83_01170 [Verrucomicrobiaceae bacterium]|nr:MAG: hypothetical protein EOP83_01170 [Verrucomicrobiaceae bacterium]